MSASPHALASRAPQREPWPASLWPHAAIEDLRLRRAPLLAAALCFAAGIVAARHWQPPALLLIEALALAALTLFGLQGRAAASMLAVATLWIVSGLWCSEIQPAPPAQQALLAYADGLSRTVQGRVIRLRELPATANDHDGDTDYRDRTEEIDAAQAHILSVDLAVTAVEDVTPDTSSMTPASGGVRITIIGPAPAMHCGDSLEAPLRLKIPDRYRDPGAFQYADLLLDQGIGTHANLKAAKLTVLPSPARRLDHAALQCRLYAAQSWASDRMLAYTRSSANRLAPTLMKLDPEDAGMLNAMLFGDRTRLGHTLRLGFERTGSFHLFVVSGMHVALLAGILFWITRRLRLPELPATLLTLSLTAAYALLTGFGAPVQRAFAMASIFLLTRLLSRKRSVLNALGAAVLAVLVWSPRSLFEASFQMTFLAILAIAGIAVPLGERSFVPYARATRKLDDVWLDVGFPPALAQLRVTLRLWAEALAPLFGRDSRLLPATALRALLWLLELTLIGTVAEIVMILPMALYFHRATVFALPANMLSIPLVALLAPLAILTFLCSLISSWLALIPGSITALLLHSIVKLIHRLSLTHLADTRVPGPALAIACGVVAIWLLCCWAVRRSNRWAFVAALALPLTAFVILWPEPPLTTPSSLEVTAIDVGQGDSLLLIEPSGKIMLVDAGGPTGAIKETSDVASHFDVGEEVVSPYLWSRRLRRLDVLVLSHAHSDHMGGMPAILRNFRPRELWVSIDPDSTAYRALLEEAHSLGVSVRHIQSGHQFAWGETRIDILAPAASYRNDDAPVNNDSLVMRVQFERSSVLLEGDAEAPSERTMLASGQLRPVTLLKVGHHGSHTSTTLDFLHALSPKAAVVSVGRNNTFGHPRYEVISRIAAEGAHLYRTDEFGLTTFLLNRDGTIDTAPRAELR